MTFKVESGIPIPSKAYRRTSRQPIYPWRLLKPGQSFFVPGAPYCTPFCAGAAKFRPLRFLVRTVPAEGGVRVWRVA